MFTIVCPSCDYANDSQAQACNLCQRSLAGVTARPDREHRLERVGGDPVPLVLPRRYRFGRLPSCEVVIPHSSVSRVHAEIFWRKGQPWIRDRSRNGTLVNGCPIDEQALRPGDEVRVGPLSWLYSVREARQRARPVVSAIAETCTTDSSDPEVMGVIAPYTLHSQLQAFGLAGRTCTIHVFGLECSGRGWISLQDGEPVAAQLDGLQGEPAVYAMLRLTSGRFIIEDAPAKAERTIWSSTTSLLIEASRQDDEARAAG